MVFFFLEVLGVSSGKDRMREDVVSIMVTIGEQVLGDGVATVGHELVDRSLLSVDETPVLGRVLWDWVIIVRGWMRERGATAVR